MSAMMHVMSLSPEEQVTIRLLTDNYVRLLAKMYFEDACSGEGTATLYWDKLCTILDRREDLTGSMCGPHTFESAKTKLYNFNTVGMNQLIKIVEMYDPQKSASLEVEALQIIEENVDDLLKKLNQALQYQYTSEEVKKAFG